MKVVSRTTATTEVVRTREEERRVIRATSMHIALSPPYADLSLRDKYLFHLHLSFPLIFIFIWYIFESRDTGSIRSARLPVLVFAPRYIYLLFPVSFLKKQ